MAKRVLTLFLMFFAPGVLPDTAAWAGGFSGGNPRLMISSPARGYLFRAVAPTDLRFFSDRDVYKFGLAGFDVEIFEETYDPRECLKENEHRTVCPLHSDWGRYEAVVVFGDLQTFRLVFRDDGMGSERFEVMVKQMLGSFFQSNL